MVGIVTEEIKTVWTYSEKDKALGHRMRAITSLTDQCDYCGAMINDCQNWPGKGGKTIWEPCQYAPNLNTANASGSNTKPCLPSNNDIEMVEKARRFAMVAHGSINQRRKYTDDPYIVHPASVVKLVRTVPHTVEILCAAWLHDVVEDTPVTLGEIEAEFGHEVAALVEQLTDVSKPTDGNRKVRKGIDRAHTAIASADAKTIKLADLIDNSKNILAHDPTFARVYLAEKELLLQVLVEGDQTLWNQANEILRAAKG